MKTLLNIEGTKRSVATSFSTKGKKLVYVIHHKKPITYTYSAIEAYERFAHRIENGSLFTPVSEWIIRNLGIKVTSPRETIPGRQGTRFSIRLKSGIKDSSIIMEYLGLNDSGYGYYRRSYEPGKYLVEMFHDSWGHQNNKMVFLTEF